MEVSKVKFYTHLKTFGFSQNPVSGKVLHKHLMVDEDKILWVLENTPPLTIQISSIENDEEN